jgi:hypothetical protein
MKFFSSVCVFLLLSLSGVGQAYAEGSTACQDKAVNQKRSALAKERAAVLRAIEESAPVPCRGARPPVFEKLTQYGASVNSLQRALISARDKAKNPDCKAEFSGQMSLEQKDLRALYEKAESLCR